ncbi:MULTISPECIES: TAXI family TRAP transporter solute-binding subunit [Aminobacterium]|uniref:TRAP transporter solute receptor, TAXI family n=1 Tax=Aminobacterium colombiense (strain DSM 12261 / ALA-1) TaxID=572547 RepID=D5EGY6_AMICL|nr:MULTISPECIES: TAXI family TRAP transporter solute-binding subunit [Aminobacterium]ADE57818.1 TRAP transporter solute receptor, TAXI family [Aminobacterium colombiense DSM 12261]MDD2379827.1 TAXI family TRAP transporter solute-binding subunit [Aminobacterium colombiense]MDD3768973.1 TAXI family TRAP transporter solute-binding subunit [Aminobacterium colombiense]MDD4586514.1 TAXI family TRAP transporter solute-binding subunit [Aminobacterium colombiense]
MQKSRKMLLLGCLLVLFSFVVAGAGYGQTSLNMGSTSSSSGVYAWCVAAANVVNKANVGLNVTVVESGAGIDNLKKVRDGVFDFAMCIDLPSTLQLYEGTGAFEGEKPYQDVRWLFLRNVFADRLYVREDAKVTTFKDLAGKRFCPGIPGSASASYVMEYNDITGANINLMPMAYGDAVNALKEGRIVGLQKSSGLTSMDASLIEVNITTPLTVIGYSKDDIEKIREKIPSMSFLETQKGSISQLPDVGPIWEECPIAGAVASTRMSEEVAYNIVKAYVEGFEEVAAAYGAVKGWDPVADYFKFATEDAFVPAHPGLIRYAKEKGIEVPEFFLPPEYKK